MHDYITQAETALTERFTLVIISHERPAFLRRTLQYYQGFTGKVLVLDSSRTAAENLARDYPGVDYRHLPEFSYKVLQDKLVYGVAQVTTPYMAFAADDDFLLHDALTESVVFLETNPEYGLCHGYGMMYLARGTAVNYYRRDKRVCEDYSSDLAEERVVDFLGQFLPPFYAVTRTDLLQQWYSVLPANTSFEWQEIGHAFYLLACAKARILPIPYAVREVNYGASEHNTNVLTVLTYTDPRSVAEREAFAQFLASTPMGFGSKTPDQIKQIALQGFEAMAQGLLSGRALQACMIVRSEWLKPDSEPVRFFGEQQFVEMPFYNKTMFDLLSQIEFLIHSMPAGRLQIKELEPILLRQWELMQVQANDNDRTLRSRLWEALGLGAFNRTVVRRLLQSLLAAGETQEAEPLQVWLERLDRVPTYDGQALLDSLPSGRLLTWLKARNPTSRQLSKARQQLARNAGGPTFGILLLDLEADMFKLQATFDSLMSGHCKAFKVVVLTTGDLPSHTTPQQTVHFVKVTADNYVDSLNRSVAQLGTDWVMLVEAGDSFTTSGLLRASLELLKADECRAVAMDEIQRQSDSTLTEVLRPGASLDMLQSVPGLMARHWLIRRELLIEAGGYDAEFSQALEFDLLLRLIARGGLAGLAHLAEPLLISQAQGVQAHEHERATLTRHVAQRGYAAQVSSAKPGTYQIDYRHTALPLVSIVLYCQNNMEQLQSCLVSVLQRTRYRNHEIVVADNSSQSPQLQAWLASLTTEGDRIRVVRSEQTVSPSAMTNLACQQAAGEYLVLLASDAQVVNANWLESLLNQAQRAEVGVVGGKLLDGAGNVAQAGLVLGGEQGVVAALVGEAKDAAGYMQRLEVEHNVSAVSAACLMIRKELLLALGGLDEEQFAAHYSDVDLCLKAAGAGYLTVWTPQAQVIHHGVVGHDQATLQALGEKWPDYLTRDPAYNANHTRTGKPFELGAALAVEWDTLLG
ncbi:N-acetylglucosaminyl-diphospho-decaprenol L-rhamnosyltransferase [compost metagenome]